MIALLLGVIACAELDPPMPGCVPLHPCESGFVRAGEGCGPDISMRCPDMSATCACEVDLVCVAGWCHENPAWYVWAPGAGERVFDAAALDRARTERAALERTLDETRRAVAKHWGRLDCDKCRAVLRPVQDDWRKVLRREAHLIGADAPRIPDLKTFFRRLKIKADREGSPDGRSVAAFLDRRVAAGTMTGAARAGLEQVLLERRRTITNPADAGRGQIAESIAQTLRWFGLDRRE